MGSEALSVIALVSGGKDSFFSILHCLANGHRVVALANLYPPPTPSAAAEEADANATRGSSGATPLSHGSPTGAIENHRLGDGDGEEADLNSFMYQTVGHQVIPLYAAATGLPLFRQAITGTTIQHGISYRDPREPTTAPNRVVDPPDSDSARSQHGGVPTTDSTASDEEDETESLVPLLRAAIAAHPEANALCTGAILSTYQRTRIESVALRLGLVPLAFLWQFPVLPRPGGGLGLGSSSHGLHGGHGGDDDAQLLRDMEAVGLEARIVKVASAGLDEDFLWENVASEKSIRRVERALRRFGGGGRGSVLGEGGEFETLVVDGPAILFRGKIVVEEGAKKVVREGGGSLWLSIRKARVELKTVSSPDENPGNAIGARIPGLLDIRFKSVHAALEVADLVGRVAEGVGHKPALAHVRQDTELVASQQWCFMGSSHHVSVEDQTTHLIADIQQRLGAHSLSANVITNTIIVLRHMSDFPTVNKIYGALFLEPNPPARVTISCGDLLSQGSGIAVYLTVRPHLIPANRQGLHVQSRSYWAPANIGPYSQAIAFPVRDSSSSEDGTDTLRVVSIAGQIPLVPASMILPDASPDPTAFQVTLALQHLWRIGVEMRTQWWTGAVAYFPRTSSSADMKHKALLAARAWGSAHLWSEAGTGTDDDGDDGGPDLWDRRYNPEYMSLAGADDAATTSRLPDWEALRGFDADVASGENHVPFVFAAEVEELPRAAGVEWHAHLGLVKVSPGSVHIVTLRKGNAPTLPGVLELQHVVVESASGVFVHTTAAVLLHEQPGVSVQFDEALGAVGTEVNTSLKSMMGDNSELGAESSSRPYLSYVDAEYISYLGAMAGEPGGGPPEAIIPCRSLWGSRGERLQMVALFQSSFTRTIK